MPSAQDLDASLGKPKGVRPIRTGNSDFTYLGPVPEIADMPCRRDDGAVYSVWQPSDEERARIAAGAQIELGVFTEPLPPVSMKIVDEAEAPDENDLRCEGCDGLYTRGRDLKTCGWCGGDLVDSRLSPSQ